MWSSSRSLSRAVLALSLLAAPVALGGCGFQPLYGTQSGRAGAAAALAQVEIANIPDRYGQQLRNNLIDRFHTSERTGTATYRLVVGLAATEQKLALRKDATADRMQLNVVASYRLVEAPSGRALLTANSRSIIDFNILEEKYASLTTADNAYDRALLEISEDITNRVAVFLSRGS